MKKEKDEEQMVLVDMEFNSVKFINFPSFRDPEGETSYSLMDAVVADRYAERIPNDMKDTVVVDFSKLDVDRLMKEAKNDLGIKSPFRSHEEAEEAEQKLILELQKAGLFNS